MAAKKIKHNVARLADIYGEVDQQIKDLKEKKANIREQLISLGEPLVDGRRYAVTLQNVESSKFDQARFRRERPKIYDKYVTSTKTVRIGVVDKSKPVT